MSKKPNVLWLMCDQLSRSALPCYGDPNVSTPNIDRLVAEGVKFNTAISNCPVCTPFRAGLFTGPLNGSSFLVNDWLQGGKWF